MLCIYIYIYIYTYIIAPGAKRARYVLYGGFDYNFTNYDFR